MSDSKYFINREDTSVMEKIFLEKIPCQPVNISSPGPTTIHHYRKHQFHEVNISSCRKVPVSSSKYFIIEKDITLKQ